MRTNPKVMRSQLRKAGIDEALVLPYEERIRQVMRDSTRTEISRRTNDLNLEEFFAVVDGYIADLQAAEPLE